MRKYRPFVFVGIVAALAGVTAVAAADRPHIHVMTVALPDGSVEQIRYVGNVAPRVIVGDAAPLAPAPYSPASLFDAAFGPDSPFAEFDRIAAEMDRQAMTAMHYAATAAPPANGTTTLTPAAMADMPKGSSSYTLVSSSNGSGFCSQSVSVTSLGDGKAPEVVRKTSGDCGGTSAAPAAKPAVAAKPAPAQPSPDSI